MTHIQTENYADPLDRASELELISTADAIRSVQLRNVQKQLPGPDGLYPSPFCIECDDEIPLGRLQHAANNILCILCATAAERMARR
jgi:RNA polymerase-binding transcription factor DksA